MIMTSDVPGLVLSPHTFALFGFFFFYSKLCYPLSHASSLCIRGIAVHQSVKVKQPFVYRMLT